MSEDIIQIIYIKYHNTTTEMYYMKSEYISEFENEYINEHEGLGPIHFLYNEGVEEFVEEMYNQKEITDEIYKNMMDVQNISGKIVDVFDRLLEEGKIIEVFRDDTITLRNDVLKNKNITKIMCIHICEK
jgi:hypothetical protein